MTRALQDGLDQSVTATPQRRTTGMPLGRSVDVCSILLITVSLGGITRDRPPLRVEHAARSQTATPRRCSARTRMIKPVVHATQVTVSKFNDEYNYIYT